MSEGTPAAGSSRQSSSIGLGVGVGLGVLCSLQLLTSVYARFESIRLKVITSDVASQDGIVSVTVPEEPRLALLRAPVVIIIKLRNDGPAPIAVTARLNGAAFGTITAEPRTSRRVDLTLRANAPATHGPAGNGHTGSSRTANSVADIGGPTSGLPTSGSTIVLRSPGSGRNGGSDAWTLEYLEIANLHGSSNTPPKFVIVPAALSDVERPPAWLALLAGLVVFGLTRLGRRPAVAAARVPAAPSTGPMVAGPHPTGSLVAGRWAMVYRVAASVVMAFVVAALLSGFLTRFQMLISPASFVFCMALLTARGLREAFLRARETLLTRLRCGPGTLDSVLVALTVLLVYSSVLAIFLERDGGQVSALVQIQEKNAARFPPLTERPELRRALVLHAQTGYDAQFAYFIAFDPLLLAHKDNPVRYRDFIDAPPYRYGRIGFSLLTKLASGDRAERYPGTMVGLVLGAHFLGALCLAAIFAHYGHTPAWGLLYVLVPGFVLSLHLTSPESIAGAGLLAGYWCWLRSRPWSAAGLFAASLLVRETGAILVGSLVVYELVAHRRRAAAIVASAGLGLVAWRGYVCWRLFPDWHWRGLFFNPENMGTPLRGLLDLWTSPGLTASGIYYPLVLLAALGLAIALLWTRRDGLSGAVVAYAIMAVSLNYSAIWVSVGNGERGTYEVPLLLMVAFAALGPEATRLRRASLAFFGGLALYQFLVSVDVAAFRLALGL